MNLIDRTEALEILGVSERQLQNYVKQGKLSIQYVQGRTGKVSRYVEKEVLSLKEEDSRPLHRPTVLEGVKGDKGGEEKNRGVKREVPEVSPLLLHPSSPLPLDQLIERFIEALSPASSRPILPPTELSAKPLLTLKEAAYLSGLSLKRLKEGISTGNLSGSKLGHSWMVRTKELISYAESLVPPASMKGRKGVKRKG